MITRRSLFGILAGAVALLPLRVAADDFNPIPLARLPGTSPFWGPKMREAIGIAKLLGVDAGPMAPWQFAAHMDRMTDRKHSVHGAPEDCAAVWLPRLRQIVRSKGLVR